MARTCRIKLNNVDAYYHVMSRTVGQEFLLKDAEKDKFVEMLFELPKLFLMKIIGFSIMSNHFHILIKMQDGSLYDDGTIKERLESYYEKKMHLKEYEINEYRKKLSDISFCMKHLKQRFSLWYNQLNNKKGHFWSDRFQSVLIESGESLLNCLAYIDLNPVRAEIVNVPEKYRWSSIHYRTWGNPYPSSLCFEGIEGSSEKSFLKKYTNFLYYTGNIHDQILSKRKTYLEKGVFRKKKDIFSGCLIMGSKNFVNNSFQLFGDAIFFKKNKVAYVSDFSQKVFSVRRKYRKRML